MFKFILFIYFLQFLLMSLLNDMSLLEYFFDNYSPIRLFLIFSWRCTYYFLI